MKQLYCIFLTSIVQASPRKRTPSPNPNRKRESMPFLTNRNPNCNLSNKGNNDIFIAMVPRFQRLCPNSRTIASILATTGLVNFVLAAQQSFQAREVSAEFELNQFVSHNRVATGAIALVDLGHGQVWSAASGYADAYQKIPLSPTSQFRIGSVTKTFLAATALKLGMDHKLDIEKPISNYLTIQVHNPDGSVNPDTLWSVITTKMLAQMTSGLYDYQNDSGWLAVADGDPTHQWCADDLIDAIYTTPPYAPGQFFYYSNGNALLMGKVIEAVSSGQPLPDIVSRLCFNPLHLNNTYFDNGSINNNLPTSFCHGYNNGIDVTYFSASRDIYAGDIVSTVGDLNVWIRSLLGSNLLLTSEWRKILEEIPSCPNKQAKLPPLNPRETEKSNPYSFGTEKQLIERFNQGGKRRIETWWGHNGEVSGYETKCFYCPDSGASMVVMINSSETGAPNQINVLWNKMQRIFLDTNASGS